MSEIKTYMDIYDIKDSYEKEELVYIVQCLDNVYIKHQNEKLDKKLKSAKR